jgi:glycosyltransferase involved in cell wall biosynthesis
MATQIESIRGVRANGRRRAASRRVLLVIDSLDLGGAERHVVELAAELAARGEDVTVACSVGGHFEGHARAAGLRVLTLCDRLAKRRFSPRFALALRRLVREDRFDLVHAHLYAAGVASAFAVAGTGVPLVLTEQTEAPWRSRLQRRASAWSYRRASQAIAVSNAIERELIDAFGVAAERVHFVPNGVPVESAPHRRESHALTVGLVARLQPEKDVATFVEAAALVADELPEARYVVAGDGPLREELEALARERGLEERLRFLGFRDDARELIRSLDVFVLSSVSEGTPLSVAEAMGAGVPVVATAVGGIPDQIEDGRDGLLVAPGAPEELARAIRAVAGDAALAERLAGSGQRRAAAEFSLEAMVERVEAIYAAALAPRRAARQPAGAREQPESARAS